MNKSGDPTEGREPGINPDIPAVPDIGGMRADLALHAVVDALPVAVFVKDAQGRFVLWNKRSEQLFGLTAEQVRGKTDHGFFPAKQADAFRAKDLEVLARSGTEEIPEEEVDSHSLGRRILRTVKTAIPGPNGAPPLLLGISEDITERRRAERAEDAARRQADDANRTIAFFLNHMNHELCTPLNGIIGMAALLESDPGSPDFARFAHDIQCAAWRLNRTLTSISLLSAIECGEIGPVLGPTELGEVARSVLADHEKEIRRKGLQSEFVGNGREIHVLADADLLRDCIDFVVDNSVKFTHRGWIRMRIDDRSERSAGRAIVQVEDSGIGIAKSDQEMIFQAFRQVDEGLTRKAEGCGLGLALAKDLLGLMGATISVRSQIGAGSTFSIRLPLHPA